MSAFERAQEPFRFVYRASPTAPPYWVKGLDDLIVGVVLLGLEGALLSKSSME